MKKTLKIGIYITLLYFSFAKLLYAEPNNIITHVRIEGLERIEAATIRSYLSFSEGELYNEKIIDESLKKIYATGLFASVDIEQSNNIVTIKLLENPLINKIVFEGNKSIKSDDLKLEMILKPRIVYSKAKLQRDLEKITAIYNKSGRFSTIVNPTIIELPQNRINLIFEIKESAKTHIKKIIFVGNKNFKDNKLENLINTKEYRWYKFFGNSDNYDEYKLEHDKDLLKRFYNSLGYADFKILSVNADLVKERNSFIVTFSLEEGNKYNFGKITLENSLKDSNINLKKLESKILTKENNLYNYDEIEDTIDLLTKYLNNIGIAFVNIEPILDQDNKSNVINIKYMIGEGKKFYLNRININGNVKTRDNVIRREFRISEGDPYNASQIARSEQRIRNLDFFEKVEFNNSQNEYFDKYDLDIDITEKSTSKINIGGGYSGTDKVLGQFSIVEDNFLGKGQQVSFSAMKGSKKLDLDISFTEPYLFNKNISAGFDIFRLTNNKKNINPYKSLTNGFAFRTGYELSEYLTHMQRYSYKKDKITDINSDASIYVKDQVGIYSTSSIGQSFFYDKLDSKIDPNKGYSIRFDQELSGLGGDAKFIRDELNLRYYKPVFKKDLILQLVGNLGHITSYGGKSVRINERFFIGDVGPYGLRGFAPGGIGPRAYNIANSSVRGDPLGGNIYYTASASLNFPIGLPEELDVSGSLFTDAGSLFKLDHNKYTMSNERIQQDKTIRLSVGAGLVWVTKLGPIRLDFPVALLHKKYDRKQYFHINFSTNF